MAAENGVGDQRGFDLIPATGYLLLNQATRFHDERLFVAFHSAWTGLYRSGCVPTIARHPDPPEAEAIANQAEVKVCKAITFFVPSRAGSESEPLGESPTAECHVERHVECQNPRVVAGAAPGCNGVQNPLWDMNAFAQIGDG